MTNKYSKKLMIGLLLLILPLGALFLFPSKQHNYDVSVENIISKEVYSACLQLIILEDESIQEEDLKTLTIQCNQAFNKNIQFLKNEEGDFLVFINENEYYRLSPQVIERIHSKISKILKDHPTWSNIE